MRETALAVIATDGKECQRTAVGILGCSGATYLAAPLFCETY